MADKKNANNLQFEEVSLAWLKSKKNEIKSNSYFRYEKLLKEVIIPEIGTAKMKNVCKRDFLDKLELVFEEHGYSDLSIRNIFVLIKSVINFHMGMLREVGMARRNTEVKILSTKEVKRLLSMIKYDTNYEDFKALGLAIVLYAGLTISELCALKWECIDLKAKCIYISSKLRRCEAGYNLGTKLELDEDFDERIVPIHKKLEAILYEYMENNEINMNHYVLSNSTKIIEPRTLQYYSSSLENELSIHFSITNLRDTFVACALQKGANAFVLCSILGVNYDHFLKRYREYILEPDDATKLKNINKISY